MKLIASILPLLLTGCQSGQKFHPYHQREHFSRLELRDGGTVNVNRDTGETGRQDKDGEDVPL